MKEIKDILKAYDESIIQGKKTALATVVKVDGSAYRRPGARMLVTEDGALTGAISGGCLEGDALRKAQMVIFQQKSTLVTYDTTDEDDQKFGIGLGCNGIIQVLIEPINPADPTNPILLLKNTQMKRQNAVLVTAFSLRHSREEQIGTKLLFLQDNQVIKSNSLPVEILNKIQHEVSQGIEGQVNKIKMFPELDELYVFFEWIKPAVHLIVFGAGNDTISLTHLAAVLGWEITLVDGRKSYATAERFLKANHIVVGKADEVLPQLTIDSDTVALLMTHNFEYEATLLEQLHSLPLPYIGILGPKRKTEKMVERLSKKGIDISAQLETNLFAPIGLDIGSESPEEIALSILAEIQAVLTGKSPIFLRDKKGPIHEEETKFHETT